MPPNVTFCALYNDVFKLSNNQWVGSHDLHCRGTATAKMVKSNSVFILVHLILDHVNHLGKTTFWHLTFKHQ